MSVRGHNGIVAERLLTPSKITALLDCAHLLTLRHDADSGVREPAPNMFGEMAQMLLQKGLDHEQAVLEQYSESGRGVFVVPDREQDESFVKWVARVGDVLSEETLAEMTTFLKPGWYGLGTDVAVFAGHRAHGHRGGIRGFDSSMWHFPDSGVSIALLSNQSNWVTDKPMEKLANAVLGQA